MKIPASEWPEIPGSGEDRLKWWQRARAYEEERELVAAIKTKMVAGEELTEQEQSVYGYSPFGSAAKSCRCQ